jgi:hypothetical protein
VPVVVVQWGAGGWPRRPLDRRPKDLLTGGPRGAGWTVGGSGAQPGDRAANRVTRELGYQKLRN